MLPVEIIIFLVIGMVVATIGALLGVGGGFLMVPIFIFMVSIDFYGFSRYSDILIAPILSLFVIIFIALSASVKYGYKKLINYRLGLLFAPFSIAGAFTGTKILELIGALRETGELIFKIIFTVLIIIVGIRLIYRQKKVEPAYQRNNDRYDQEKKSYYWIIPWGFLTGLSAGLVGIGGGIIAVPAIHLFFLETIHVAIATSLFIMIFTASFSTLSNFFIHPGALDSYFFIAGLLIAVGAIIGSQIGSYIQTRLKGRTLQLVFGIFLVGIAIPLLWLRPMMS